MLKRKIWSKLEDFRANANKKTLLLTGARQVGKTYIVDHAKPNFSKPQRDDSGCLS